MKSNANVTACGTDDPANRSCFCGNNSLVTEVMCCAMRSCSSMSTPPEASASSSSIAGGSPIPGGGPPWAGGGDFSMSWFLQVGPVSSKNNKTRGHVTNRLVVLQHLRSTNTIPRHGSVLRRQRRFRRWKTHSHHHDSIRQRRLGHCNIQHQLPFLQQQQRWQQRNLF